MTKCPGQDQRYWQPDDIFEIECPHCGTVMEFWKDDASLACSKCGKIVRNARIELGCAKWCQYAAQCLGISPDDRSQIICDALIDEMKSIYGSDTEYIDRALSVLANADKLQTANDGDPLIVKAAAIFHDIIPFSSVNSSGSTTEVAERVKNIINDIFVSQDIDPESIDRVCRIIADLHLNDDGEIAETPESKIVGDAKRLVAFSEKYSAMNKEDLTEVIDRTFKTKIGYQTAIELYVK